MNQRSSSSLAMRDCMFRIFYDSLSQEIPTRTKTVTNLIGRILEIEILENKDLQFFIVCIFKNC